ncbi:GTPase-activating protein skywalker-like isoform X2 [Gigantopelta aegis]|uniref:GTPase-activating protein skywalker-like isoform X2 n=1 Tax=Gigantopelta aegis TaxID=1735272 RepID=UPI001B88854C|nr:GTPase-activating protein skywalker-like isoform X2 [Gigantopelta aegis]
MMHGVTLGEHASHDSENGVASHSFDAALAQETELAVEEEKPEEDEHCTKTKICVENVSPFTEYVNMDDYRRESQSSVESDESYEGSEDQLMMLFKMGHVKQLKKFLRMTTWPDDHLIRHSLWLSLCKHLHKADGNLYDEMEKELFSQCDMSENIPLPGFLDQTHLTPYYLSDRGVHLIGRIIAVINHTNPDITYSPATFAISSLFLHYMGPSETFNCLYALLHSKELMYISQTKVSLEASKYVLRDLTKKFAKSAYVHLVRHSKNVENIFDNWIWWIYRDLPFSFLVKLTDCFLVEGVKVLYRAVLAILILYTKMSGKLKTSSQEPVSVNISNNISRFCERMPVDITKFLKIAFGIRGLSRKEIHKLQVKHEMYINSRQILTSKEIPRVASSISLCGVPVSRTFTGPVMLQQSAGSHILSNEMLPEMRARSRSLGMHALHNIHSSIVTPEEVSDVEVHTQFYVVIAMHDQGTISQSNLSAKITLSS